MSISKFCAVAYGDINAVIGEDEGRVGGCKLGGRHLDCMKRDDEVSKTELTVVEELRWRLVFLAECFVGGRNVGAKLGEDVAGT